MIRRRWLATGAAVASIVAFTTCRVDQLVSPPLSGSPVVQPSQVTDSALLGSLADRTAPVTINSSGASTLSWTASRAEGSPWLVLSASSGTTPATLTLTMNPAGLALGTYRDTVVIEATGNTGDPTRLPVLFEVNPCRVDTVNVGGTITDSLTSADCSAPHFPDRFAKLYRFRAQGGDSISVTGTASSFPGALVLDSALTGSVAPLAEATDCAGASGPPCLRYVLLPRSGYYVIEATSASAHDSGTFALTLTPPRAPASPATLAQFGPDSATAIPAGASAPDSTLVLAALVADSDVGDSVRLEADVVFAGAAFTDTVTDSGSFVLAGKTARVLVHGLHDDSSYQWRVRAVDQTGRTSAWVPFGTGGIAFHVAVPQPPDAPTGLTQLKSDGTTIIALGDTTNEQTVLFRAAVTDPDPGDSLHLDVEVRPVGTAFTGTPSGSSVPVGNGQTATATVGALTSGVAYHWQARVVDETNRTSPWVSYGGNAESAADFEVQAGGTQLAFVNQPTAIAAGATISPAVTVVAQTLGGATDTTFTGNVAVAIAAGTGTSGATLGGTLQQAAVKGRATFGDLTIDRTGAGYRLTATTATLTAATSDTFSVVSGQGDTLRAVTATALTGTVGGTASANPTVIVVDAQGNPVSGVTVTFTPGAGSVSPSSVATGTNGQATTTWTLGPTAGAQSLNATALVSHGSPTTFTANVSPGPVSQLVFTQPPTDVAAGAAIAPAIAVAAEDAQGNVVTTYSTSIGLAIGTNPGGGTLTGGGAVAPSGGVATFANASIDKAGTGYTLTATSSGLPSATSAAFNVTSGTPDTLRAVSPTTLSGTVGTAVSPAPTVIVVDSLGNPVSNVSVSFTANNGGSVGSGAVVTGTNGQASTSWTLGAATGTQTLSVASGTLHGSPITFSASAAAGSAVASTSTATVPNGAAGAATAITVQAKDANGNNVTTGGATVVVSVSGANTAGPITAADNNDGTYSASYVPTKSGTDNVAITLNGSAISGSPYTSVVTTAPADTLRATSSLTPTGTVGSSASPAPTVIVVDSLGNPVSGVKVAFAPAPGDGTVAADTVTTGAGGQATTTWTLGTTAGTQTLSVSSGTLHGSPITFTATASPGTAGRLHIVQEPSATAQSGVAFGTQPLIQLQDTSGNDVSTAGIAVTASIVTGTGTLDGTVTVSTNSSGQAVFTNLGITGLVGTYALGFSGTNLTGTQSSGITLSAGAASQLVFTQQPSATVQNDVVFPSQPVLQVADAAGNPVSGTKTVIAAIASGDTTLSGSRSISTDASGLAAYTNLKIRGLVGARTLLFSSSGVTSATSDTVHVAPGAVKATQSTATVPTSGTAGAATTITVQARDTSGNALTTGGATVVVSVSGANTATPTVTDNLNGTYSATYTPITAGTDDIAVTLNGGAIKNSPFTSTVGVGAPSAANTSATVSAGTAGAATPISITVRDASGNKVTGQAGNLSIAVSGTNAGATVSNVTQQVDSTYAASYTPTASGSDTVAITLSSTAISGSPYASAVSAGAADTATSTAAVTAGTAGSATTITVTVRDANGNKVTGQAANLGFSVTGTNAGAIVSAASQQADTTYTATYAPTVVGTDSVAVTLIGLAIHGSPYPSIVSAGAATHLVFTQQPTNVTAGVAISPAITVTAEDANNNVVTAYTTGVTLAIGTNAGGGTLSGGGAVTPVNGVATFSAASIDKIGTGYTLTAASGTLTGATSTGFNVTAAPADSLRAVSSTTLTGTVGGAASPTPTVIVVDSLGNPVSGVNVTFAPSAGTVGTQPVATGSNGQASTTWTLGTTAGAQSLTATATGLAGSPVTFNATASAGAVSAAQSTVAVNPTSVTAGASATVTVTALDGSGNPVSGATVVLAMTGTGNTVTQPAAVTDVNGVATGTVSSTVAEAKTISATAGGTAITQTAALTVTAGTASAATSTITPAATSLTADGTSTTTLTAQLKDANGNNLTTASNTVTLAALYGAVGTVTNNNNGTYTATYTAPTTAGTDTIVGTLDAVAMADSAHITLTAGPVNAATSTATVPTTGTAGTPTAITVQGKDANGNNVTTGGATVVVTVTGANTATPTVTDNGNGTYAASYTPTASGTDDIAITLNSGAISGSPFTSTVSAAAATQLVYLQPPTNVVVNTAITPAIRVAAEDPYGNIDTTYKKNASLTIVSNPGSGTLSGNGPLAAVAGVATFASASINQIGTGYTLQATSNGLTPVTSAAFNVTAGAADTIRALTATTLTDTAGAVVSPAPTVIVVDANGNPVSGASVTFAPGTGSGAVGTQPVLTGANGQATTTWTLGATAGTQTLTATLGTVHGSPVTFTETVSAGTATKLVFTQGPSNVTAGVAISPAITVAAEDANNNVVSSYATGITLAIGTNAGGGTLTGGGSATPASGVATYSAASINKIGTGYTLTAASGTLTGATSGTFNVTAAPADTIRAVTATTLTDTAGAVVSPAPAVIVVDSLGNPVSGVSVTFTPTGGTVGTQPVLTGTNGQASTTWTLGTGTGTQTLDAAATVPNGSPVTFTETVGAGNAVGTTSTATVPNDTAGGTTTIVIQAKDANGNNVTTGGAAVVVNVTGANTATPAVVDSGNGKYTATYTPTTSGTDNVAITLNATAISGSPYTSTVTAGSAVSLSVTGIANPSTVGTATNVTVTAQDQFGNVATGYLGTVHFTSTDVSATLPADYTFVAGDNGTHTFTNGVTFATAGSPTQTVTATDTVIGTITGSQSVTVN